MTALSAQESMNTIDKFIREVGATEKIAAEANTEAGSIGGATEHPVKDVDDHTDDADEGFRSKENDKDVKADEGPPSVDNQPIATPEKTAEGKSEGGAAGDPVQSPGSAADDQIQIGTVKEPTGDDPSVETGSVKEEKEDSGGPGGPTAHPATTENNSLDGLKYAESELEEMPLEDLAKVASNLNNALLAELAVHDFRKDAGNDTSGSVTNLGAKEAADDEVAAQAGWELAGLLTGDFDKEAADALVEGTLEEIIKTASGDADNVSSFLTNYSEEINRQEYDAGTKQANEEALAAMLQGGGGEEGGMPEEATMDAVQGMGGPETGGEGGGLEELLGGMGGGEEEELAGMGEEGLPEEGEGDAEQLMEILEELGVSPEELEEAIAAEGEGGLDEGGLGGGLEGGLGGGLEGGLPQEAPEEQAAGLEVEAADKAAAAKKGSAGNAVRDYIQELISRSRQ